MAVLRLLDAGRRFKEAAGVCRIAGVSKPVAARTLDGARRWAAEGTALFLGAVAELSDAQMLEPSALPGWTVGQVIGHVAANADALGNLADWARTGVEKPMYASPEAREATIESARTMSAVQVVSWFTASAAELNAKLDELTADQWRVQVTTRKGQVRASEIPWMRAREVCVHAVDLGLDVDFEDLPGDFLEALVWDICGARGLDPEQLPHGPIGEVAAWLAGRPYVLPNAPELGPWL